MQRVFKITVNGTDYDVAVEEFTDGGSQLMPSYTPTVQSSSISYAPPVATATSSSSPTRSGTGDQCAQMGGVVALIHVKEGQSVNEGDKIMELEAMKMKVPVMANCSGKISRILVAVGDGVENGQALLTIA